jgi:mannose-6-phosphate isomerase-like protein (cupin superfamily)
MQFRSNKMIEETIEPDRGTNLRKNGDKELKLSIDSKLLNKIFLVNGTSFFPGKLKEANLTVKPNDYYMIINKWDKNVSVKYGSNIVDHKTIYEPYKFELSKKEKFDPVKFGKKHKVPSGYIDTLNKWYSIKFTYPEYSLIYVRPEIGISIQIHHYRSEHWKVLKGKPIVINAHKVHYFVENGMELFIPKMTYHSVLNPNKNPEKFVVIEERWSGKFDEEDIDRIFNPNNYR